MGRSPQSPDPRSRDRESPDQQLSQQPPPAEPSTDHVDGVPTFDFVRDRIEGRYATAMGSAELAQDSAAGRSVAQQEEEHEAAARERLEQIRRSVRGE
jgi:phage shock protein A